MGSKEKEGSLTSGQHAQQTDTSAAADENLQPKEFFLCYKGGNVSETN